jgi:hypothetical protein
MFIDYCKSRNITSKIEKIVLIEPSKAALKRGALNVKLSSQSINQNVKVYSVNKKIDEIVEADLTTQNNSLKIHLFSNILDVEDFSIVELSRKIQRTQEQKNIYVCVSPNFYADGTHSRNQRLIRFLNIFDVEPELHEFSDIGYIITFKTGFSQEQNQNLYLEDDDLPF